MRREVHWFKSNGGYLYEVRSKLKTKKVVKTKKRGRR